MLEANATIAHNNGTQTDIRVLRVDPSGMNRAQMQPLLRLCRNIGGIREIHNDGVVVFGGTATDRKRASRLATKIGDGWRVEQSTNDDGDVCWIVFAESDWRNG